ncbi:hypothetical protein [Catellatospora citrea]|nr:hypothetical protein [Catellatospora citrea]RKE05659.1 hypothetical protein C8E86_0467 [Catellatospora citrea]
MSVSRRTLRARGMAAVTAMAGMLLAVAASPANAGDSGWPTKDQVPIPAAAPPLGEDPTPNPRAVYCEPGEYVYSMTNTTNTFDTKYATSVINTTNSAKSFKFTATTTGTTTYTVSISVSAELKAGIFAKIAATINGGVSQANTTSYGAEVSGTVDPHTTLYGDYGNWKENVTWKSHYTYSNCSTANEKAGSAYAPYREAWKLWEVAN